MVEQEISREVLTPNALRFRFIIWYHIIHSVNGDESDITVAVVLVNVNQVERPDEWLRVVAFDDMALIALYLFGYGINAFSTDFIGDCSSHF